MPTASARDAFGFPDGNLPAMPSPSTRHRRDSSGSMVGWIAAVVVAAIMIGGSIAGIIYRKEIVQALSDRPSEVIAEGPETTSGPDNTTPKSGGGTKEPKEIGEPKGPNDGGMDDKPRRPTGTNFPRRALLINVNNYLFANEVRYGSSGGGRFPGSSTSVLKDRLTRRPFNLPHSQIIELADGGRDSHSTLKTVIETTIADFCKTSRRQDRIIVFFCGHAIDGEKEAYLMPLEGDMEDPKTLIPLKWVYDKLAACKAQEKLLILDVCRNPLTRGFELPGSGPMGEILDKQLQNPPKGVQVWSSCILDQESYEFERGSLFVQAWCKVASERIAGIANQDQRLPLDDLVAKINAYMKDRLDPVKLTQVSRLTGNRPPQKGLYNPDDPMPRQVTLKKPMPKGGDLAGEALVEGILNEIDRIPPVRATRSSAQKLLQVSYLPPFEAKRLGEFKADYGNFEQLKKEVMGNEEMYPLRHAVIMAMEALRENAKFTMREKLFSSGGSFSAKIKEKFLDDQEAPGIAIFELERALKALKKAGEKREEEKSKRWQAHYDYTLARLLSRLVYTYEYSFLLGQVRGEDLPELNPAVHNGWRIGSRSRPQIPEDTVRNYVREIRRTWTRIIETYPGTPWEILAKRESMIAIGLEWRPSREI